MPDHSPAAFQSNRSLDPRTKLLLVVTIAIVLLTGGYDGVMVVVRPCLAALPLVLLLVERRFAFGFSYMVIFALCMLVQGLVGSLLPGFTMFLVLLLCGFFLRLAPGIATAYYVLTTTTVNDLVAGLERMHVSQSIVIPLAVMLRFIPTLGEEINSINRAVRMRGVRLGSRPFAAIEYRLMPLMMCSLRIGEELSAAALTRGLGAPVSRTSISTIGFHALDIVVGCVCLTCFAAFVLQGCGVL